MITLTKDTETLTLPQDLFWQDEFEWSPVSQSVEYSTNGALLVDIAVRQAGRTITLSGESNSAGITRQDLQTLSSWEKLPGQVFTLDLRGQSFEVIFDHGSEVQTKAIAQTALVRFSDITSTDFYCNLVLRFLEI